MIVRLNGAIGSPLDNERRPFAFTPPHHGDTEGGGESDEIRKWDE